MIDKDRYTSFIRDEKTRLIIVKNLSKLEGVLKNHDVRYTEFLDPYQRDLYTSIINSFDQVAFSCFPKGNGERKIIVVYPNYYPKDVIDSPVAHLKIVGRDMEGITHKDVLGALTSLGVVREKIGDITKGKDGSYLYVEKIISKYFVENLTKIKNTSVKTKIIPYDESVDFSPELEHRVVSVASMRLDNVIAAAYNLNREKAKDVIKKGRVKLNHRPVFSQNEKIEGRAMVSVRGKGRIVFFGDDTKESKKGNIIAKIGYYK